METTGLVIGGIALAAGAVGLYFLARGSSSAVGAPTGQAAGPVASNMTPQAMALYKSFNQDRMQKSGIGPISGPTGQTPGAAKGPGTPTGGGKPAAGSVAAAVAGAPKIASQVGGAISGAQNAISGVSGALSNLGGGDVGSDLSGLLGGG